MKGGLNGVTLLSDRACQTARHVTGSPPEPDEGPAYAL